MRNLSWAFLTCGVSSTFFFFNDTATTEIYTLSLHDALPISRGRQHRAPAVRHRLQPPPPGVRARPGQRPVRDPGDRKSTRLNSSHGYISYAVFCLKKKKHQDSARMRYYEQLLTGFHHARPVY